MSIQGESSEQLERRLSDTSASDRGVRSEHASLKDPTESNDPLSKDDPPTTAEVVLRILSAVEHISSKMDQDADESASKASSHSDNEYAASLSDIREGSVDTQSESCCPDIERLPMSSWNPPLFLNKRLRGEKQSIVTAFYTDVPTRIATAEQDVSNADFIAAYSKDKWSSAPRRVLIQSKEVMDELRWITGVPDAQKTGVLAMVPPFKYLIHYRAAIKSKLDELKKAASDRRNSLTIAKDNLTNENQSIRRLQCICDFIQTDLANYIGLELKCENGDIEEVLFEEAYHLFKPGDLVMTDLSDDQLYQISSVTGGRMLLSSGSVGSTGQLQPRDNPKRAGTWTELRVSLFNMMWDGENIGCRHGYRHIPYFPGTRSVTDLPVFPLRCHKDSKELRKRLCVRGSKYVQCSGHKRYTGTSVIPHNSITSLVANRPVTGPTDRGRDDSVDHEDEKSGHFDMVQGDIYIDYRSSFTDFFSTAPGLSHMTTLAVGEDAEAIDTLAHGLTWNCSDRHIDAFRTTGFLNMNRNLTRFSKPQNDLVDEEPRLQLLPGQVPAFVFATRKWEWLNIDDVEDINKSEESRNSGWNELVIPHKFSELLLSLVSNHISDIRVRQWEAVANNDSTDQIDLVRGKGRGLIILLHGPPGSGKTSTAETIAAYTGRPLYAITCGDLGTSPKELERNIVQHTRLAQKWGCVLLLDEADVFLGSRTYDDMQRNAVVSVFLRQLEYYSGIMFLTTNIVGVIDEAFKSRIHVALEYPAIDEESTLQIWSKMLQRIKRNNEKAEMKILFDESALMKFAKRHYRSHKPNGTTWNGRQIRNAFQTAIGIGQYKRLESSDLAAAKGKHPEKSSRHIKLTVASFQTVAETTSDFERYIRGTRGDDRERAAAHQFRRDEHGSEPPPKKSYPTPVSLHHTDQDTGSSRAGRSRRYAEASTSPVPRRTAKGKEVRRKARRDGRSASPSDSDEHTGREAAKHQSSDEGSDEEEIIEHVEDEDEDE